MNLNRVIAKNIRKYKELQKISFIKIAKKAKIPFTTLETILYKKRNGLNISTLLKISKALNVKLDDLIK
jgi:transcriptional regulator with XRE-family HTH domain